MRFGAGTFLWRRVRLDVTISCGGVDFFVYFSIGFSCVLHKRIIINTKLQSLAKMRERVNLDWDSPWFGNDRSEISYEASVCEANLA